MSEPKILFFDIETSPLLGYTFGLYEQNVVHVVRDSFMMSFAWKWFGEKKVYCKAISDYPRYKKHPFDDSLLVRDLHALIDSADIVVAHNGDGFDVKVANARFITNKLEPLSKKITIDTLKVARTKFKFASNKLNDLAHYAGLGHKLETGGKYLWINCIDGDLKAWKLMKRYNIQDVVLLEGIYLWMRPWMTNHPNWNVLTDKSMVCPNCGSHNLKKNGFHITRTGKFQNYCCKNCGSRPSAKFNLNQNKPFIK